jgi:PleD family two-component response regulator
MDSTMWTTLLFNFLSCGLIELKAPDAVQGGPLDFIPEAQGQVETITSAFTRPETGIYSYAALLYFMAYEYDRFEAYNYPLSLVIFEVQRKREDGKGGSDLLIGEASNVAAQRINMVKRPLDTLGHFETLDYGLLLPNTTGASAAWVANRIYEGITATPLIKDVDRNTLSLAFGIASLPADGDDLQSLVMAARDAKNKAKSGNFPIVMSRSSRR